MKKNILLIISNMESGGVSKSMSSLLNKIDTKTYNVDCFILSPTGLFLETIPKEINIISFKRTALLCSCFPANISKLLTQGYIIDAFIRVLVAILMKIDKGYAAWLLSRRIELINKEYDLAVDYNGQHQLYYLVDKVKANKKVSFFHSDYKKWPFYYVVDKKYFPKVDKIFTISDTCVDSLKEVFPLNKEKIELFENISPVLWIKEQSKNMIEENFENDILNLISIGHITEAKGFDLAIEVGSILRQRGINYKWYFLGNDSERSKYQNVIEGYGISDNFIFLGTKENPYPYIEKSDIVVHLSRFEGKSIALDEAKILCKPIVVTNFSTVNDQFKNRYNASICNFVSEEIADAVIEIESNIELKNIYINNLKRDLKDNSVEIKKLYTLID